jgi:hypothetical protein
LVWVTVAKAFQYGSFEGCSFGKLLSDLRPAHRVLPARLQRISNPYSDSAGVHEALAGKRSISAPKRENLAGSFA